MGVAALNVAVGHPVFYAGRFVHRVTGLPEGCELLGDWDVLPARLAAVMERADTLVVLDPLSFPFEALTGTQQDVPLIVVLPWELDVDTGIGRWAASFDPAGTRFCGVDISEGMVAAARANFPQRSFEQLGPDLGFPYEDESFDLVFSVTVMHHNPTPAKRTLLSEMWRVAKPGGRLL